MKSSVGSIAVTVTLWVAALCAGCTDGVADFNTPDRLANGLIVILPGIEGESGLNHDIRNGLVAGGVQHAVKIRSWGRLLPPPLGMLVNQMDVLGNRLIAKSIANEIAAYQKAHPDQSVYVVGHSGGGGIAVFVAEAMPDGHQVDGVVLLSASISSAYNVTKALGKSRQGIANFYNRSDGGLLGVGTTVFGNVDGAHGPAAGMLSFDAPRSNDPPEKQLAYQRLFQIELRDEMTLGGGAHTSSTVPGFVSLYVAPWILSRQWPAGSTSEQWTWDTLDRTPTSLAGPARGN